MAGSHVYLDELNANTRDYKVKVKVVEKGRPITSPVKGTKYQTVILEDDRGNVMRGALFGDQIESFKDAILYNGVYEIANAPIRFCAEKYRSQSSTLAYQMTFGGNTAIQPLHPENMPQIPAYQNLVHIPRAGNSQAKFDIVVVVLFVEAVPRKTTTGAGQEILVTEVVASDHSTGQPMVISAWNDLAEACSAAAASWAGQFTVVGFTALRTSTYKGFSLSTTMSTEIIQAPEGERAQGLTSWVASHMSVLADRQMRVLAVRNPEPGRKIITVKALLLKKAGTTLQEERHWIRATASAADLTKINAYPGCSVCGSYTDVPLGMAYTCTKCKCADCTAVPRVTFSCEFTDGSASLQLTAFSGDTSKLCRMTVPDLYKLKHDDDHLAFDAVKTLLENTPLLIEVGPKVSLSKSNVLQWNLKTVAVEGTEDEGPSVTETSSEVNDACNNDIPASNIPPTLITVSSSDGLHALLAPEEKVPPTAGNQTSQPTTPNSPGSLEVTPEAPTCTLINKPNLAQQYRVLPPAKKIKKEPASSKPTQTLTGCHGD